MIGKTIGSYRVIDQIGLGGMATVYKAYDPGTDRYVALKILPEHYSSDPTFRERFQTEARAIAKLEHLHILPVYSYGEENGTTYLVMRYMEAGTLAELLKKGGLSFRDIILILDQVAGALDYAHERGVLHRDVKSSNILLDAKLNAYLTDFGIAKMVESSNDITGGNLIGTPQYMSPEQCKGGNKLTPATDQYALGVVLFEMLTGRLPFQGDTPMAVMLMQMHEAVPSARKLRPDMTADMEKVLETALAKEPTDRYTTCSVMATAFTAAVNSYPPLPRTILTPAKPTMARVNLGPKAEKVEAPITDQPKRTISLAPEADQINAVAFGAALVMGGIIALFSSVLLGIPSFLQMATGALYVYLARRAGLRSGPVISAVAAGAAGLIGGVAATMLVGGVLLATDFLEQSPLRIAAAIVLACGPVSAIFAALGGIVAAGLMPPAIAKLPGIGAAGDKPSAKPAAKPVQKPAAKPAMKADDSPKTPSIAQPAPKSAAAHAARPTVAIPPGKPADKLVDKRIIKLTEPPAAKPPAAKPPGPGKAGDKPPIKFKAADKPDAKSDGKPPPEKRTTILRK